MMELDKEYIDSVNKAIKALIVDEILASIKKNAIKGIHFTPYVPKCKESVMCVKRIIPNARSRC